jgi:hypothetical protein
MVLVPLAAHMPFIQNNRANADRRYKSGGNHEG